MKERSLDRFRLANAKRLREEATNPERLLWHHLERIPIHGTHFRRQAPIGRYIVDFVSHHAGLVIGLDGSQHASPEGQAHDTQRTAFLESQGYRVIRFWNGELHSNLEGVLDTIYAALYGELHAPPTRFERRRLPGAAQESIPTPTLRVDPPPPGEGESQ